MKGRNDDGRFDQAIELETRLYNEYLDNYKASSAAVELAA